MRGRIINLTGGLYSVLLDDNSIIKVKARGKLRSEKKYLVNEKSLSNKKIPQVVKSSPKVGDIVVIENDMIDHYEERKNELIRPDIANVDQILLIFSSKKPDFSFYLLDLFILNVVKNNIYPIICVTKIDLLSDLELLDLKSKLKYYEDLGYKVLYTSSMKSIGIDCVHEILKNKITIFSGQTGAGKSSLINELIPGFELKTQEISDALGRGKHTTREISLYQYMDGLIGDTPGFSKLEAINIKLEDLDKLFIEFKNYSCRFKDCNHLEKSFGCGIRDALSKGEILESRYQSYVKLYDELKNKR
ncbi:MAG: ribosome small subunit-dependent GTPase A [Acholeplasmatales bacterium]|nr:ribosome small subunit-dependent GTPase A [Acholeplasmatales bacterium]